jgi:hypothetical protein
MAGPVRVEATLSARHKEKRSTCGLVRRELRRLGDLSVPEWRSRLTARCGVARFIPVFALTRLADAIQPKEMRHSPKTSLSAGFSFFDNRGGKIGPADPSKR